jgi:Flp pilus assembly pilin Flp
MNLSPSDRVDLERLRDEESGQTMAEYGLVLTLLSAALFLSLTTIGSSVSGFFASFAAGL